MSLNMAANFYALPSSMTGGFNFPVYSGKRRQKGGKLFGSFRNFMAPIGKHVLQGVKSVARNKIVQNVAKGLAKRGTEVLASVAVDALQGKNVGEAFKERTREAALSALTGSPSAQEPRVDHQSQSIQSVAPPARNLKQRRQPTQYIPPAAVKVLQTKRPASRSSSIKRYQPKRKKRRRGTLSRAALNREELF